MKEQEITGKGGRLDSLRMLTPLVLAAAVLGGLVLWYFSGRAISQDEQPGPVPVVVQGSSFDTPAVRKAEEEVAVPAALKPPEPTPPVASPTAPAPPPRLVSSTTETKKEEAAALAPKDDKPIALSFAKIASFRYLPPTPVKGQKPVARKDAIPDDIRALDGKKVNIEGYCIPIDFDKGKMTAFVLSRVMFGCCYGDTPRITELIKIVRADGKPIEYFPMVRVSGAFEVGEEFDDEGYVESVFRIKADKVFSIDAGR